MKQDDDDGAWVFGLFLVLGIACVGIGAWINSGAGVGLLAGGGAMVFVWFVAFLARNAPR